MSLSTPLITGAQVSLTAALAAVNPVVASVVAKSIPITLGSVANLTVASGTFTPANNKLTIGGGLTSPTAYTLGTAPNFVFILVDQPANVYLENSADAPGSYLQINKMQLITMNNASGYYIITIVLDGTTASASPMAQGVPVNYTLITCTATIS